MPRQYRYDCPEHEYLSQDTPCPQCAALDPGPTTPQAPAQAPGGTPDARRRPEGWQTVCARFPTARLLWDAPVPGGHLRAYSIDAEVFLIHDYADGHGWQVYSPTTTSGKVDETLDAIEARARRLDQT